MQAVPKPCVSTVARLDWLIQSFRPCSVDVTPRERKARSLSPKDSCNAFHILLKITHFVHDDLPKTLTKTEVVDLAALYDKYQLGKIVLTILRSMNWLAPHKGTGTYRPSSTISQEWAL